MNILNHTKELWGRRVIIYVSTTQMLKLRLCCTPIHPFIQLSMQLTFLMHFKVSYRHQYTVPATLKYFRMLSVNYGSIFVYKVFFFSIFIILTDHLSTISLLVKH